MDNSLFDDCNCNDVPDADDIAAGTSTDANTNGVPDECELLATIVSAASILNHGGTDLALDLTGNNIEPRADGVLSLEFEVSALVSVVGASVSCVNNAYGGSAGAVAVGTTVAVELSEAPPDEDCCTITLGGDVADTFPVRTLRGDINRDGVVSTADASIIKPKFGQIPSSATAAFDYNVDGIISTADFSQVKPRFGNAAPSCP